MKLSVMMITYNHERYIRQALDSVLMQKVDFDYEIVVGEDRSTDSTRAILEEYSRLHPGRFRLLLRNENLGVIRNFFATLAECRGQYIALLEGDDYWTCDQKLRRQVEFLDSRPDCAVCFHNVNGHFEDGRKRDFSYVRADQPETIRLEDLLNDNVIPTCSTMFRRGAADPLPSWVHELRMADYPLHVLNARSGRIGYINEVMGVYRIHSGGVWTGLDWFTRLNENIKFLEYLSRELRGAHRRAARRTLAAKYWHIAGRHEARGDLREARRCMLRSLQLQPFPETRGFRQSTRFVLRTLAPSLYGRASRVYGTVFRPRRRAAAPPPNVPDRPAPRVSIVIPAYNAQRYLAQAVNSMLSQTWEDFECLVIDDGSTDRTPEILDELSRNDSRVRPIRIPHGGIVEALNAGIAESRGDLIARMDADDVALPSRLAVQVRYMDEHPRCVALGSRVLLVDPYNSPLWEIDVKFEHEQIEAELLRGNGWALFHPTAILRREAAESIGGYRPEYQWSEDVDLFLRLAEIGSLANLPDALLRYRQHFSSVNRTKLDLQSRRVERLLADAWRRRGRPLPSDFRFQPVAPLPPYEQVRAWCRRAIVNHNFPAARRHALAAMRFAPMRYDSWSLMYHAVIGR